MKRLILIFAGLFILSSQCFGLITQVLLDNGEDNSNLSSYTTINAISPPANQLLLLAIHTAKTAAPVSAPSTITGCNLTWTLVDGTDWNTLAAPISHLDVYRALSTSPGTGCTLTIGYAGVVQTGVNWAISAFASIDRSGSNGAGAIAQSVTDRRAANGGFAITLAAFGATANATYGIFGLSGQASTVAVGSGFNEITNQSSGSPSRTLLTEWRNDNDTTVDASWTPVLASAGIAIELKASTMTNPLIFLGDDED